MSKIDITIGTEEEVLASMLKDSSQVTIKHQQISSPEIQGDLNKSIEGLIKKTEEDHLIFFSSDK